MPTPPKTYAQRLPALGLSIEQNTSNVPADNFFYLLREGDQVGRFRTLKAARDAWAELIAAEGWKPPEREKPSAEEMLRREKTARDRADYFEYWNSGRRHSW